MPKVKNRPGILLPIMGLIIFILIVAIGGLAYFFYTFNKTNSSLPKTQLSTEKSTANSAASDPNDPATLCQNFAQKIFEYVQKGDAVSISAISDKNDKTNSKEFIQNTLTRNEYQDLVSQKVTTSEKHNNVNVPNNKTKQVTCQGSTQYSTTPKGGWYFLNLINYGQGWLVLNFEFNRDSIDSYGNIDQDYQGIKKQTASTLYIPQYIPSGYKYIQSSLLKTKDALFYPVSDGANYNQVATFFNLHPEQMKSGFDIYGGLTILQNIGYKPTLQEVSQLLQRSSSTKPEVVNFGSNTGVYLDHNFIFEMNSNEIMILDGDKTLTKEDLSKIAQSFVEVQ